MKGNSTKSNKNEQNLSKKQSKTTQNREIQETKPKKEKEVKKRFWTAVLYPESAPENWREEIKQSGLVFAVSPLHDRDINADGTPKKAHHHLILVYNGPTTFSNVESFLAKLNQPIPKALESVRGMYRYFTHEENPEKAQYDKNLIEHYNGFSLASFCELMKGEVVELKKSIISLIRASEITEYAELIDMLIDNEMWDELDVAENHTFFFNTYITSRRHRENG